VKPPEPLPAPAAPRPRLRDLVAAHPLVAVAVALALSLAVAAAYRGSLDNALTNWDDDLYSTRTAWLMRVDGETLPRILTDRQLLYWHPLSYLWHATENHFWGARPENHRWYHLTSVLLHLANAGLAFALFATLLRRALPSPREPAAERALLLSAGAGALLWALHPLRVESVAWMAEKKDLLSALFGMAAALAWLRRGEAQEEGRTGRGAFVAAMALGSLAIASKLQAVVVPGTLLVLDAWPRLRLRPGSPRTWIRPVLEKWPLWLVAAGAAAYTLTTVREIDRHGAHADFPLLTRCLRGLWGLTWYPWKSLWPSDLCPVRPLFPPEEEVLANPVYAACAVALLAAAAGARAGWRTGRPWFAAAGLWYLVTIAPVCGFKQLGLHSTADRFAYTSTLGLFALAAGGAYLALRRGGPLARATLAAAVLLAAGLLGRLTVAQVEVWRDSVSLWTAVIDRFPGRLPVAYSNLGAHYHQLASSSDDPRWKVLAEEWYGRALEVDPGASSAWNNLGLLQAARGDRREAERSYRRALAEAPRSSLSWANLAVVLVEEGRRQEAEEAFGLAVATGGRVGPAILQYLEARLGAPPELPAEEADRKAAEGERRAAPRRGPGAGMPGSGAPGGGR
jgi:hypothetical protein